MWRVVGLHSCMLLLCVPATACVADGSDGATETQGEDAAWRIVSLMPSTTQIVVSLGASARLVARTEEEEDPGLARLPSVGHLLTPNLEALRAVEPDLVVTWSGADVSALKRALEGSGGSVRTLSIDRLSDVGLAIDSVGSWIGRTAAADSLRREVATTLDRARRAGTRGRKPRLLWVVGSTPLVAAGSPTFIDDMIQVAGGTNVAAGLGVRWPLLGFESLLRLDPDIVVWPDGVGLFPPDELAVRPGWSLLRAVRAGRVLRVRADRFDVPGPGIADATLELAERLDEMHR